MDIRLRKQTFSWFLRCTLLRNDYRIRPADCLTGAFTTTIALTTTSQQCRYFARSVKQRTIRSNINLLDSQPGRRAPTRPKPLSELNSNIIQQDEQDFVQATIMDDDEDDDHEFDESSGGKIEPWRSLLEIPSRAAWRVTDQELVSPKKSEIQEILRCFLQNANIKKSKQQVTKTHEKVIDFHNKLKDRRDRERMRALLRRKEVPSIDNTQNRAGYSKSKKDENMSLPLPYGPDEVIQHIQFRFIPQYAIVVRILQEVKSLLMKSSNNSNKNQAFSPKRVLDFGIGTGSASAAALNIFPDSIEWIHGVDPSRTMRETTEYILKELIDSIQEDRADTDAVSADGTSTIPNQTRLSLSAHLSSSTLSMSTDNESGLYDMALMCYTASEFPQNTATMAAAAMLWEKLRPNGIFVMIEPGTPDGFTSVRTVRNLLLHAVNDTVEQINDFDDDPINPADYTTDDGDDEDSNVVEKEDNSVENNKEKKLNPDEYYHDLNHVETVNEKESRFVEQCHVIAPCTHNGPCPMERFFKFKQRLLKNRRRYEESQEDDADSKLLSTSDDNQDDEDSDSDNDDDFDDDSDNVEKLEDDDFSKQGYCSFVQMLPSGSASITNKGEKFTYIVMQKRVVEQEELIHGFAVNEEGKTLQKNNNNISSSDLSFEELNIVELLRRSAKKYRYDKTHPTAATLPEQSKFNGETRDDLVREAIRFEKKYVESEDCELGLEFLRGDTNRQSFGRILRAPKKKRGHIYIDTCAAPGAIVRHTIRKNMSSDLPGMYTAARKSRWGGLWPNAKVSYKK
jgi:ribosomal protein RSM22 (predicted rRNA methylase)